MLFDIPRTLRSTVVCSSVRLLALLPLIGLPMIVGCGGNDASSTASAGPQGSQASQNGMAAGATGGSQVDPLAAPKQTVAVFLDCLRRGDEATANSMLTTKARAELQKTAWAIQPLGTPEGKYTIGRAGFPYEDQKVVLVECKWKEPVAANEPELNMDIVCELYEDTDGWRIAGMAVTMSGEEEALVIDFEDGTKLQEMLDLANGISNSGGTSQLPPTGTVGGQPNNTSLPAFPEYPPAAGGTQIALPPNSNPVLR